MKKWIVRIIIAAWIGIAAYDQNACAQEEPDFEEIQLFLEDNFGNDAINFEDLVTELIHGNISQLPKMGKKLVYHILTAEMEENRAVLTRVVLLAVSAALFTGLASVFGAGQISQNAWFVIYLMLSAALFSGFSSCFRSAEAYLNMLLLFMQMLIPAFSMTLAWICSAAGAGMFYQITFLTVAGIDWLFLKLLFPAVKVYVCFYLINQLTEEDYLSGFLELMQMIFDWMLKTVSGVAAGLQVIQGLILPAAGQLRGQAVSKLIQALPGIGSGIRSTSEILYGTGIVIKNGVGAAGCLIIAAICLVPVVRLGMIVFFYYLIGAVLQPVSDERIRKCLDGTASGIRMLLKAIAIAAFLFALSIALICIFTNRLF